MQWGQIIGAEQLSVNIANRYYEKFGETLEYENVFYFKALLDKVRTNKTYDIIVINEELERYKTKDIEQLDRVLFSYVDKVTDESEDAEIVYICSDRREKNDKFIERLYSIGIYNILIGNDREIGPLCDIIKKPKTKKEAKEYLNIDSSSINETGIMRDDEVDEGQMMNILNHYESIREQPDQYIPSFDHIATLYNRAQLKVIASWLPKYARDVIYNEPKYKFLAESEVKQNVNVQKTNDINVKKTERKHSQDFFGVFKKSTDKFIQNVGALSALNKRNTHKNIEKIEVNNVEKIKAEAAAEAEQQENIAEKIRLEIEEKQRKEIEERRQQELAEQAKKEAEEKVRQQELAEQAKKEAEERERQQEVIEVQKEQIIENVEVAVNVVKNLEDIDVIIDDEIQKSNKIEEQEKREAEERAKQQELMERAKKEAEEKARQQELAEQAKKEAEEKLKQQEVIIAQTVNEIQNKVIDATAITPGDFSEEQRRIQEEQRKLELEQEKIRKVQAELEEEKRKIREEQARLVNEKNKVDLEAVTPAKTTYEAAPVVSVNFKKMVVMVGAKGVGTTFVVNAIAHNLSNQKILTSIIDMTKEKNMYYIYNQDDKGLRKIASECMQNLSNSQDTFIPASRYLKIYTGIPNSISDVRRGYKHKSIIETAKNNANVTIVDADFTTPIEYFEKADEIYVVQDMDVLKIQETTTFLREMKNRNMDMNKIRIIVNKYVKNAFTPKKIIGGLSNYTDPERTFIDSLLTNKVMYSVLPYDLNNYVKYTEALYKGNMNFKGYTAEFEQAVNEIVAQIYPRNGMTKKSKGGFFG